MNRLLVRVKPIEGECFGGYTARLARENAFDNVQAFLREYCQVSRYQLYKVPLNKIASLTDIKEQHKQNLWLKYDPNRGFTYKGHFMPNQFVAVGSHFCAQCLASGGYTIAQWNLGWLPVCLTHRTLLTVGCKDCKGRLNGFNAVRCNCIISGLDHAEKVSDDVFEFIVGLERELQSSKDARQWRAKVRTILSEGYLKYRPFVYGRSYRVKDGLPDKLKYRLSPRLTVDIYKDHLKSRMAA